jgi:hypothetical protein
MIDAGGGQCGEHVIDDGAAGQRMQDFRHAGAHARPLAGGQYDGRGS